MPKINSKPVVERTIQYSLRVIRLYRTIYKDPVGKVLGNQLLRSGTSIGANVHEAQAAQSKADFISKMSISQKEVRESEYWIKLLQQSDVIESIRLDELLDETIQLSKIIASIIISSKKIKGIIIQHFAFLILNFLIGAQRHDRSDYQR